MLSVLKWLWKLLTGRKKKAKNSVPLKFKTQKVSYAYCLFSVLLFGAQGLIAAAGSLDVVFPDIPSPIGFNTGRAIHLNLSIIWPVLGLTGAAYYFFPKEAGVELHSPKLAVWQFRLTVLTTIGILGTLTFGITEGREYLEAWRPFKAGLALVTLLFIYNLSRTYLKKGVPKNRPTLVSILVGIVTLALLYIPNLFYFRHQTVDELVRFWVVHLWEEMSLELVGAGVVAALLFSITQLKRKAVETILYLDLTLATLTGFWGTGHHYYWVGTPGIWLWIGGIFSGLQVVPILLLAYASYESLYVYGFRQLKGSEKLALAFLLASVFYHVLGAGALGLVMAIPAWNRWTHGTYITSAHSHLALFGVFGFLSLAVSIYVLTNRYSLGNQQLKWMWLSFFLLNGGLVIMGGALTVAGLLETYLWRVAGLSFQETQRFIWPYLLIRVPGGMVYAAGSSILTVMLFKLWWQHRKILAGQ